MTDAAERLRLGHVFRPGPFRARRTYWLDVGALHWRIGNREGHTPLAEIASIRFRTFDPSLQSCSIVEKSGRRHVITDVYWRRWTTTDSDWRSPSGLRERHAETGRALTHTLARRVRAANPDAALLVGPSRTEWVLSCIVLVAALGVLLAAIWLMIAFGRFEPGPAAFAGALVLSLPPLWPVIRSGGPAPFDPETLEVADPHLEEAGT